MMQGIKEDARGGWMMQGRKDDARGRTYDASEKG